MTNQEIYDKVCKHLAQQKRRAVDSTFGLCRYRLGELKCAVGALIPDECYSEDFEELAVSEVPGIIDAIFGDTSPDEMVMRLLRDLQTVHDCAVRLGKFDNMEKLHNEFKRIAAYYKLQAGAELEITEWDFTK